MKKIIITTVVVLGLVSGCTASYNFQSFNNNRELTAMHSHIKRYNDHRELTAMNSHIKQYNDNRELAAMRLRIKKMKALIIAEQAKTEKLEETLIAEQAKTEKLEETLHEFRNRSILTALGLESTDKATLLEKALSDNDYDAAKNILHDKVNTALNKSKVLKNQLQQAIESKQLEKTKILMELGADAKSILREGIKKDDYSTVNFLLQTGIDLDNLHEKKEIPSKTWYTKWYDYIFGDEEIEKSPNRYTVRITQPTNKNVTLQKNRNKILTEKMERENEEFQSQARENAYEESLGEHIDDTSYLANFISDKYEAFNAAHPETRSEQEQEYQNNFDGQSSDLINDITATLSALDDRSDEEKEEDRNNAQEALDSSFDMYF